MKNRVARGRETRRRAERSILLVLLFLVPSLAGTALAAPPPGTYDALRIEAPEVLIIEVLSVRAGEPERWTTPIRVEARVLAVERSASGLAKGDRLTIEYGFIDPEAMIVGPRRVPMLVESGIYPAFLETAEGRRAYRPAAYGASFEMTPEESRLMDQGKRIKVPDSPVPVRPRTATR